MGYVSLSFFLMLSRSESICMCVMVFCISSTYIEYSLIHCNWLGRNLGRLMTWQIIQFFFRMCICMCDIVHTYVCIYSTCTYVHTIVCICIHTYSRYKLTLFVFSGTLLCAFIVHSCPHPTGGISCLCSQQQISIGSAIFTRYHICTVSLPLSRPSPLQGTS